MPEALLISVTFLDSSFHGRSGGGAPEWPPSPLRLFQAVVAANGQNLTAEEPTGQALRWLERQPPPEVWAPKHRVGQAVPSYVPNNAMDIPATVWARGNNTFRGSADPGLHRAKKVVRATHLPEGQTVHFLWATAPDASTFDPLTEAVGRLVALGWGIDLAVAQARTLTESDEEAMPEATHRWLPDQHARSNALRVPKPGTLDALIHRHKKFLGRLDGGNFTPSPPLTHFRTVGYRRADAPLAPPHQAFELRRSDGSFFTYPARKLTHLAGQVRHAALSVTLAEQPAESKSDWRERFVAGHRDPNAETHRQISYLPLPSIGHRHTDPSIRRFLLTSDHETGKDLHFVARLLAGQRLIPEHRQADPERDAILVPVKTDPVLRRYVTPSTRWASVTPVILPGHNDRRRTRTRKLVEAALRHAGVTTKCHFETSNISRFPQSHSAAKPNSRGAAPAYFRPNHLQHLPAVHLEVTFEGPVPIPGPLSIGAGRHQGLGVMANLD